MDEVPLQKLKVSYFIHILGHYVISLRSNYLIDIFQQCKCRAFKSATHNVPSKCEYQKCCCHIIKVD